MESLLDDLLRAESSARELIDADILIQKVVEQMRPLAEHKRQVLTLRLELDTAAQLMGDPMLLGEAMENYLSNAIKYTAHEGHIRVESSVQDERLHFVVEDNGPGIAAQHLPHLFEAYYRLPDTPQKGYGIGLNLVKTIVERHAGQVWVESKEGVGSRFGFWLPLND
jgi:signal transduction histidine kinase